MQTILDRIRGGHCISVPPFLRPIEEEDNTSWSDECCHSEVGITVKGSLYICDNKADDIIKALPVDRPCKGKRKNSSHHRFLLLYTGYSLGRVFLETDLPHIQVENPIRYHLHCRRGLDYSITARLVNIKNKVEENECAMSGPQ